MKRHARPREQYDLSIARDAVLMFVAIVVLIAVSATGYA
jgi:hypothetical protein